jgi:hypothetical protein
MLNLYRFRPTAIYAPEHAHLSPSPCTGLEATDRYRAAMGPVLPPGASLHFMGKGLTTVAGPDGEKWDRVMVIRYQSLQGFIDMVESEKYKREAEPHRLAGLEEWRLILMEEVEVR